MSSTETADSAVSITDDTGRSAGTYWMEQVIEQYDIEETDPAWQTVVLGARALDRAEATHRQLAEEGLTVDGLHGPRVHPCVSVARDAEASHLRACRLLGIYAATES